MESQQSTKRVLKKLSALRATLSDEEQVILDGYILDSASEVTAHSMTERITPGVTPAADAGPDEMMAHSMTERITPGVTPAADAGPDEMMAHSMTERITPGVTPAADAGPDEMMAHS
ncbi:MAG: hypothetical protein J5I90_12680, partial [Caldilineales bacterium]|nr:hypothetical protein [Caldilineales bacterium]